MIFEGIERIIRERRYLRILLFLIILGTLPFYCIGFVLWGTARRPNLSPGLNTATFTPIGADSRPTNTMPPTTTPLAGTATLISPLQPTPRQFVPLPTQPPTVVFIPTATFAPTLTPFPTNLPAPTQTPIPAPTETPLLLPTETLLPAPTETPIDTPTDVPLLPPTETPLPTDALPAPTDTPSPTPGDNTDHGLQPAGETPPPTTIP
jgi:type VI secretion system secreted protein VgrG